MMFRTPNSSRNLTQFHNKSNRHCLSFVGQSTMPSSVEKLKRVLTGKEMDNSPPLELGTISSQPGTQ